MMFYLTSFDKSLTRTTEMVFFLFFSKSSDHKKFFFYYGYIRRTEDNYVMYKVVSSLNENT